MTGKEQKQENNSLEVNLAEPELGSPHRLLLSS